MRTARGKVAPMKTVAGSITATAMPAMVRVERDSGISGPIHRYTPTERMAMSAWVAAKARAARSRSRASGPARPPPSAIPVRKAASMEAKA